MTSILLPLFVYYLSLEASSQSSSSSISSPISSPISTSPSATNMNTIFHAATKTTTATASKNTIIASSSIRTRFILMNTHHPGNVGAAARAMKTMGFEDNLVLINPHDPKVLNRKKTKDGASGAMNVLQEAQIFTSLPEALEGIDIWCATGMPNDMSEGRIIIQQQQQQQSNNNNNNKNHHQIKYYEPRVYFEKLVSEWTLSSSSLVDISKTATTAALNNEEDTGNTVGKLERNKYNPNDDDDDDGNNNENNQDHPSRQQRQQQQEEKQSMDSIKSIAFVFGNERTGMTREDMDYCHIVLGIPTNPKFGSLNLASAVQLIAYDWRQALGGFSTTTDTTTAGATDTTTASLSPPLSPVATQNVE